MGHVGDRLLPLRLDIPQPGQDLRFLALLASCQEGLRRPQDQFHLHASFRLQLADFLWVQKPVSQGQTWHHQAPTMDPCQKLDSKATVAVAQPKALHPCDVLLRRLWEEGKLWKSLLFLTTEQRPASNSDKACSFLACAFLTLYRGTSWPTSQTFTQKKTHAGSEHHCVCVWGGCQRVCGHEVTPSSQLSEVIVAPTQPRLKSSHIALPLFQGLAPVGDRNCTVHS